MFINLEPEPQKAGKVKRNVPIYLFHTSVNIENCIGLGLIISVRISSAEVFVLHWSNGGKQMAALYFFSEKLENGGR